MGEKPMFEDCTTGLTCSAIEAEMRDRLAAKDARIAELSSAVAGKVQLIEPDPETIAWAEGVFAAEDAKNATIEDLSRKLEASRHRVAELEAGLELALTGGNHIANQLIGMVGADFASKYPPDMDVWQVAEKLADPVAHDLWCCWSAMMLARSTLEGKQPNAETQAAMQELEDGGGEKFVTVDELLEGKSDA